ncbi:MAG TPA: hypothetical protein VEW03_10435, partial [Longimicrobiaceae bacterium]|nr:hypothetical protein [Longimicrobiaceae bacterium]
MRLSRRSLSVAGFSLVGLAVVFAACTDDSTSPVSPEPPVVTPPTLPAGLLLVECRANLTTRDVSC